MDRSPGLGPQKWVNAKKKENTETFLLWPQRLTPEGKLQILQHPEG